MIRIKPYNLLSWDIKLIDFQFLWEEVYQSLQFLAWGGLFVFLYLEDFDAELAEDELADVEIGAMVGKHVLVDESGVACVWADYFDDFKEILELQSVEVHRAVSL